VADAPASPRPAAALSHGGRAIVLIVALVVVVAIAAIAAADFIGGGSSSPRSEFPLPRGAARRPDHSRRTDDQREDRQDVRRGHGHHHAPAGRGTAYHPDHTLDGVLATSWQEGAPGDGLGQSLTFRFSEPVVLTTMRVVPGYQKVSGWDRWGANGRLATVTLTFSDGSTDSWDFLDQKGRQERVSTRSRPAESG
jgi:hypothetical protein